MKTSTAEPRTTACADDAERSSNKFFFENADKPTLHGLSYSLRHPETWPKGFIWDYSQCSTCAMGLAHRLWNSIPEGTNSLNVGTSRMARAFSIPYETASQFFFGRWPGAPVRKSGHFWWTRTFVDHNAITPEMVADQIDKYIATAE